MGQRSTAEPSRPCSPFGVGTTTTPQPDLTISSPPLAHGSCAFTEPFVQSLSRSQPRHVQLTSSWKPAPKHLAALPCVRPQMLQRFVSGLMPRAHASHQTSVSGLTPAQRAGEPCSGRHACRRVALQGVDEHSLSKPNPASPTVCETSSVSLLRQEKRTLFLDSLRRRSCTLLSSRRASRQLGSCGRPVQLLSVKRVPLPSVTAPDRAYSPAALARAALPVTLTARSSSSASA